MSGIKDYEFWHRNEYGKTPTSHEEIDVDGYLKSLGESQEEIARWKPEDIESPAVLNEFKLFSPGAQLILDIKNQTLSLADLHWRDFEKIVAELLKNQGWNVQLGRGSKDGGIDVLAERNVESIGTIRTIWQAKHLDPKNKVGIKEIRELHSVVIDNKVNRGVMVTSTYLTRDAIERVERDKYLLSYTQKPNILHWIEEYGI